jgi:hypothetical protein
MVVSQRTPKKSLKFGNLKNITIFVKVNKINLMEEL